MSASWFLVSMYLIWILGSRLIQTKNQSSATRWVLETCLIVGLLPFKIILITAHFAVLRSSLISLALGPPTSSGPGVATPFASVNPKAFKARETCCWSGSYPILHCRNVSVLPKKLAVRDYDGSGLRVTTLLSSCAPRSKLSACSRSSCRPTMKKSSPCTRMYISRSLWKK